MKKTMKKLASVALCLSVVASSFVIVVAPHTAMAAQCGDTQTFFEWNCNGDNVIESVLVTVLNWLAVGVSVAVVIGIIYGAISIASAGGDEGKMKHGIEIIRNAVIALILYFLMYSFLNFIIPGGVFN